MKIYRVALIGCGNIANLHAGGYAANRQFRIVALVDVKADTARAFAVKHGLTAAAIFTNHKAMLRQVKPDVVSICLWTRLHAAVVKDCAAAGVPAIHCEKPMAASWTDALAMARTARKAGAQLTFNHQRRKLPVFQEARRLVRTGAIGRLLRIEAFNPRNILDWGTHVVDLTFKLNGEVAVTRVLGQIDVRQGGKWFDLPFEQSAIAWLTFANGVTAVIQSGEPKEMNLGFRLHGTGGTMEILETKPHLRLWRQGGSDWRTVKVAGDLHTAGTDHMRAVMRDIAAGLGRGRTPELSVDRALRATEVIYAWFESALQRRTIELPLKPTSTNYLTVAEA